MSNRDDGGALVGLSRRDAAPGMSATSEHVLEERGFDLVAALFGGPDSHGAKLPDAALALLVHGIVLDFVARHLPGPGSDVLAQEIHFAMDPAVGDKVVVSGTADVPPRGRHGGHRADGGLRARAAGRRYGAGAPARGARDAAAGSPGRHHPAPPSSPQAADGQRGALAGTDCGCRLALRPRQPARAAAGDARGRMKPILVGPRAAIEKAAADRRRLASDGAELSRRRDADVEAAMAAVRLCREGRAEALMKGSLHTDELMARRRVARGRAAHRAPHQPCLRDGRAVLSKGAIRHRRRDQHRPRPR